MTDRVAGIEYVATTIAKHSLVIAGHKTSISLESVFWDALKREASESAVPLAALVAEIDARRGDANLSSAIRVHLFLSGSTGKSDRRRLEVTAPAMTTGGG